MGAVMRCDGCSDPIYNDGVIKGGAAFHTQCNPYTTDNAPPTVIPDDAIGRWCFGTNVWYAPPEAPPADHLRGLVRHLKEEIARLNRNADRQRPQEQRRTVARIGQLETVINDVEYAIRTAKYGATHPSKVFNRNKQEATT